MARAFDDKTSTCGSCAYWEHLPTADGIHPVRLGICNWNTLPVWAYKPFKKLPISPDWQKMREDAGNDPENPCWCHTKRESAPPTGGAKLLRELSLVKGGSAPSAGEKP